jgi:hypothetical protein
MRLLRRIMVPVVEISISVSLYIWRYTLWKIGSLSSPKTSFKHVLQVK